ncbi:hypothetical protein [Kribbella solani]|uniref:REase associating with pPIWI RE domain-containing protein n=1 Tax=Kribbella solani TaxID=236067 RepID=A0A841DPM1_9ACTN|nr:hypothetical protein [Kribbella solani]MBB5979841.1 hypothetical protein [Kribbella solani]
MRTVAGAVIDLDQIEDPGLFRLPYPPEVQRALDRTVLACLLRGAEPPLSVPELLAWCRERPVVDWPLDLPADLAHPDDLLIDPEAWVPTDLCYEWAVDAPDAAVEQIDRALIHSALDSCRSAGRPASYVAFRRLLIEHPVLSEAKLSEIALHPELTPVDGLLERVYLPAPDGLQRNSSFAACSCCELLLVPTNDGLWWCENPRCRVAGTIRPGTTYPVDEGGGVRLLTRPLRLFVTMPGRAELALAADLAVMEPELWPNYDAYDLRITMPDGQVWAVDVKDWANPALLGRNTRSLDSDPPYDRAFVVVPDHRLKARRSYVRIARRSLRATPDLEIWGHRAFVREAKAVWKGTHA